MPPSEPNNSAATLDTSLTDGVMTAASDQDACADWTLKPSRHLEVLELGEGEYAVWNRFFPIPTLLNDTALEILRGAVEGFSDEELEPVRTMFLNKKLAFEGDADHSEERFLEKIGVFTDRMHGQDDNARSFYGTLEISNDPCNVGCSYCMIPTFKKGAEKLVALGKKPPPARSGMNKQQKLDVLKKIIDQYVQTRLAAGAAEMPISMSGGEMLAQWPIVKGAIEYVAERYPEAKVSWMMNSSLTILTEEQAEFLGRHGVTVHTSIDGYKENHDNYRTYHNGKGTFDDVMKGLALYNEHNPEHAITAFQGTIANADEFDANRMMEFVTSKFDAARMAPNLLGISEEEGEKQADLMMDLQIAGGKIGFEFGDTIFEHMKGMLEAKGDAPFGLYCTAMSNQSARTHVNINLSSMQASRTCSFVPSAHVELDEVDYDIFHPSLWEQNLTFAQERVDTIKKYCMSCEIAGICHGACVLNGIDANNQINPGGCAYLRRLWRRMLAHVLNRNERMSSTTAHRMEFDRFDKGAGDRSETRSLKVVQ